MDMMPYCPAVFGFSSTLSFTIFTLSPSWVKLPEQGSIEGELAYIGRRHIFDSAWRLAVGLEITNQYGRLRYRKAVDLTGDRHGLTPTEKRPYNGNFGPAARHKKFTEAG